MAAPPRTEVGIYVDLLAPVHVGDFIRTQTGRSYQVVMVRRQLRGKHAGRQHLRAIVLDGDIVEQVDAAALAADDGQRIHQIRWYRR